MKSNVKFKRAISCVLVLIISLGAMVLTSGCTRVVSGTTDDGFYYDIKYAGNKCVDVIITGYKGSDADLVIPSEVYDEENQENVSVVSIGASVFSGCESVQSVFIGENICIIDDSAFSDAPNLSGIKIDQNNKYYDSRKGCNAVIETETNTLISGCKGSVVPKGVEIIGGNAFKNCDGIKSISLPESVRRIDGYAFSGCTSLEKMTFSDGLERINNNAFEGCEKLDELSFPTSLNEVGKNAFDGTAFYSNQENWTEGILYINDMAFEADNEKIDADCVLKKGTKRICEYAFADCERLESITFTDNLESIGIGAFSRCDSIAEIKIPESLKEINHNAFEDCTSLESVTLHSEVTAIKSYAFEGCSALEEFTIPKSVKSIGYNAFCNTGIYLDDKNWQDGLLYIGDVLIVAEDTEIKEKCVVKEGTRMIADNAFERCDTLKEIEIPDSVRVIGNSVFEYCTNLSAISMPTELEMMGKDVFNGCEALVVR